MTKRKSITKKIRFEVFKRDAFKCQYCGSTSPDVTLEVDHIKPVAEGGDNDITNLITSCKDCNRGKGAKLLDDKSTIEKQRKQLEELNERRAQLEMMMEWREGLKSLEDDKVNILADKWRELVDHQFEINENGLKSIKKWLKKFDINTILDCMEISASQYLKIDKKGNYLSDTVEKAFKYTPRIATNKQKGEEKPYMKDLYYIRGILRNRGISYHQPQKMIEYLEKAHVECDVSISDLREMSKSVRNWTVFVKTMEELFEGEGIDY